MEAEKICTKCHKPTPLSEFGRNKNFPDGLQYWCKTCKSLNDKAGYEKAKSARLKQGKEYRKKNLVKIKKTKKVYYEANKDSITQKNSEYLKNNPEIKKKSARNYAKNHPEKLRYHKALRRARKLEATPPWFGEFDEFVILEAFILAKDREKLTGVKFHVDHIVPLRGRLVSGFHCGLNIQVITAQENLSKNNKFEVDE